MDDRLLLEEYLRRSLAREKMAVVVAAIRLELFSQQLAFIDDPSRNKAALCTRRAGKTEMWSRYGVVECLETPGAIVRIWGINRLRAKQLVWAGIRAVCARHKIPIDTNETELTVKFENGSEIRLLGGDKDKEVQKKRGDKTKLEVVLEAQLFGSYLKTLVEDVAEPCLLDLRGTMCLEGTPGPVCTGYWYYVTGGNDFAGEWSSQGMIIDDIPTGAGWSCHRWSVLDNPFMPHAREELALLKVKRHWTDETPTYKREWRALWVNDLSALYYHFDPKKNVYDPKEIQPFGPGWQHVLGWDLGFNDDMALVVWGWHPRHRELFEVASWKRPGALSEEVVRTFQTWERDMHLEFIAKVADTQGGGKMYVEDVVKRHSLLFEAAKKTEKYAHVMLFNDDLQSGFIKLRPGSVLLQEMAALPKDPDAPKDKPPAEHPAYPNHACDAGLYSWRRAWHFTHEDDGPTPAPVGSRAFYDKLGADLEQKLIDSVKQHNNADWLTHEDVELAEDPR